MTAAATATAGFGRALAWATLTTCVACSSPESTALPSTRDDSLAIVAASQAFSLAYMAGDAKSLAQAYGGDGAMLPPNGAVITDPATIERYWTHPPDFEQLHHSMTSERLEIHGETALDIGVWYSTQRRGAAEPKADSGRYMIMWKRDVDTRWRILSDMWHRPFANPGPSS